MQVMSVWPSKGGVSMVPHLELELGCTCFLTAKRSRRKRWGLVDSVFCGHSEGHFMGSSKLRISGGEFRCMSSDFYIRGGILSGCSKVVIFSRPKEASFGSSFALAMALQHEEVENELRSSVDGVLEGSSEDDDFVCQNLDGAGDGGSEQQEIIKFKNERIQGNDGMRIDVRQLAEGLHFAKNADDVEMVLKDKGELRCQVFSSMLRGLGWEKKIEPALALVEWLKRKKKETDGVIGPNVFIYNSLLSAVKNSKRYELAEEIVNDMIQNGIHPNVVTHNALMIIYVEQGQPAKALKIFEELQTKGFTPDAASYSTALLAYRNMEDANGALRFFVGIKEKYLKGELGKDSDVYWKKEFAKLESFVIRISYQVMRRWLVRKENMGTHVLKLLTDMDNMGLQPGRAEYERLIWACTREEHYRVGKELYTRIRERHSEISLSVCNHLIWLLGKAKKWWAALEIYEDLLDRGPMPNAMSYDLLFSQFNILLSAARRRGIWKWGVRLLNKMEDKGLKPGSKEWDTVLVACSKASETAAAVQIFRRMIEKGQKPTDVSYGALLSALEKGKLYDEAVMVWNHMLKVGVVLNLYVCTTMASVFTCLGKFNMVDTIIQEMVLTGIGPTVVTYNAIISACARNNMSSAAYEWFHRMKVQNIVPDEVTYEMLIKALAADGKPRIAYELYLRAQNEGLILSSKAYDAIAHSSHVHEATINIDLLGPRPPDKKNVRARKVVARFCASADIPRSGNHLIKRKCMVHK